MLTFNDLRPKLPFIVRQEGTMVQIKPFAGYYTWLDWFDLAAIDPTSAIAELTAAVEAAQSAADAAGVAAGDAYLAALDAQELAIDAGGTAIDALNDAATAQAAANAAQTTANTGVTNAATAQAAANAAQADATAALAAAGGAGQFYNFSLMMDEAKYMPGTPSYTVNALYPYNFGAVTLTAPAQAYHDFRASAGTWTIHIMTYKGPNAGRLLVNVDGVTISGPTELYQSAFLFPHIITVTGVVLTGDPDHVIDIYTNTKHASSSAYGMLVFKIWGERTGA